MAFEAIDSEFYFYIALWIIVPVALFVRHSRGGRLGGCMVYSYILGLLMSHWFGAIAHISPWSIFADSADTIIGFRYSTYGLLALAAGTLIAEMIHPLAAPTQAQQVRSRRWRTQMGEMERVATIGLIPIGIASFVAFYTPLAQLPSVGAVLSVGKQCLLLGICLHCRSAWQRNQMGKFYAFLSVSALLPIMTVATSGFIGYGIVMTTTILAFVAMFYRPRWHLAVGLFVMLYGGVSLWVSYAAVRGEIRESVWGGAETSQSLTKIYELLSNLSAFDLSNSDHLFYVDIRLNQNYLVGAAIRNTPDVVPFRYGDTILMALAAVVPRAIWPEKPEVGGSGNYVSQHTLIEFAGGTSVGMGQILEFYINFGLIGVLVGCMVFGTLLRYADIRLAESLTAHNWQSIIIPFLVASGLLQAGGSLSEVAASCATGWVVGSILVYGLTFLRSRQS